MHLHILFATWVLLATASVVQSRRWFASEVGRWITQEKIPASWEEAQQRCDKHGAILASPLNTQLLNYMQSLINVRNHSAAYFIGTRTNRSDDGQEVHYVSVEGRRLDDMPQEVFEEIEQLDIEQGDCLSMDRRRGIRAVSCWDHLLYICYSNDSTESGSEEALTPTSAPSSSALPPSSTPPPLSSTTPPPSSMTPPPSSTAPPPSSTAPTPSISPGYTYQASMGSWYKYHKTYATWDEAHAVCVSENAGLVLVNDEVEAETVRNIMRDGGYGIHQYVWINLRDYLQGGSWQALLGGSVQPSVYRGWSPSRAVSNAHWTCAVLNQDKLLYNWTCNGGKTYFICEVTQTRSA